MKEQGVVEGAVKERKFHHPSTPWVVATMKVEEIDGEEMVTEAKILCQGCLERCDLEVDGADECVQQSEEFRREHVDCAFLTDDA